MVLVEGGFLRVHAGFGTMLIPTTMDGNIFPFVFTVGRELMYGVMGFLMGSAWLRGWKQHLMAKDGRELKGRRGWSRGLDFCRLVIWLFIPHWRRNGDDNITRVPC